MYIQTKAENHKFEKLFMISQFLLNLQIYLDSFESLANIRVLLGYAKE